MERRQFLGLLAGVFGLAVLPKTETKEKKMGSENAQLKPEEVVRIVYNDLEINGRIGRAISKKIARVTRGDS